MVVGEEKLFGRIIAYCYWLEIKNLDDCRIQIQLEKIP